MVIVVIVAIVAIVAIVDGEDSLGWARWRLPICVGLMVAPLLYRLLCYIYNVWCFWGGASITCLRYVPTYGWNLAPDLE